MPGRPHPAGPAPQPPSGEILATASGESDDTIVAELFRDRVYAARRRWPMLRDRRPEVYGPLTASDEDARGLLITSPAWSDEVVRA
jgi:hypothetical protein